MTKSSGLASFVRLFNSQMSFNKTRFKLWHLSSSLHSCTHSERLLASRVLNVWPRSIMPWIDDSLPQFVVVTLESCISMKITRMTENWRLVMLLNFCILNSYLGERYYLRYQKDQTFSFRLKNLSSYIASRFGSQLKLLAVIHLKIYETPLNECEIFKP